MDHSHRFVLAVPRRCRRHTWSHGPRPPRSTSGAARRSVRPLAAVPPPPRRPRPQWMVRGLAVAILWASSAGESRVDTCRHGGCPSPLILTWFAVLLAAVDLATAGCPTRSPCPPTRSPAVAVIAGRDPGRWLVDRRRRGHGRGRVPRPPRRGPPACARASLGAGDVKLSGSLGAVLGAAGWPTLVLGAWLAAICTLGLRVAAPRRSPPSGVTASRTAPACWRLPACRGVSGDALTGPWRSHDRIDGCCVG